MVSDLLTPPYRLPWLPGYDGINKSLTVIRGARPRCYLRIIRGERTTKVVVEFLCQTGCFNTTRKDFVLRQEEPAYYLATCADSASALGQHIRGHWGIENRLHYVLDTSLDEDASRICCNPGIFALIHQFAFNLLRYNGQSNLHAALYNNALCLDRLLVYRGIWEN